MAEPLLQVQDLQVTLQTNKGAAPALRNITFALHCGETLGLVGESGSGKSMLALALMGLLPEGATTQGSIRFDGKELAGADDKTLRRIRGARIGMVFQEPMTALNPVHRVGRQIAEPLRLHKGLGASAARAEALRLLDRVGIPDAARRIDAYPHAFSGGQRQRITIAMALACNPDVLIADEPTTALDVTVQRQVLHLIRELVAERGMALILVSHDLGVIAENVQRMLVLYGGSVVEAGRTADVFARRAHPYTRGLFAARPQLGHSRRGALPTIRGSVPALADLPRGCPFAGRCDYTVDACHTTAPPPVEVAPGHTARCIRLGEIGP